MRQDIAPHFRRGRRRERRNLGTAQRFEHLIEPKIIGPKIVAPHRETMRFIHSEKRDRALSQRFEKRPAAEAFRRDVDQFEFAPGQRPNALPLLAGLSELLINVAEMPRRWSASTWSFISAINGETTTVVPSSSSAGIDNRAICRRRSA